MDENQGKPSKVYPNGKPLLNKITDIDKVNAKKEVAKAFAIAGFLEDGNLVCPGCGTSDPKKIKIRDAKDSNNTYYSCHKCSAFGDAIDLLQKYRNMTFSQAVNVLLDRDNLQVHFAGVVPTIKKAPSFKAKVDVEVYNFLANHKFSSAAKAVDYYGIWHIKPDAVLENRAVVLTNVKAIQRDLHKFFSEARLKAAGVMMNDDNGNSLFLFSESYNVMEPHILPNGDIVGMQFRPSTEQMLKVKAHKDWKKFWSGRVDTNGMILDPNDAWRMAYDKDPENTPEKSPFTVPFLSLKGAGPESLVGCGLERIGKLAKGSKIYVVEGFKDLLAARTLGVEAYAIPGVGSMPSDQVCDILRPHHMVIMLDGDQAGEMGRKNLLQHFAQKGISASIFPNLREGLDVTDILVELNAHAGCLCGTCQSWLKGHPYDQKNCTCRACKMQR